jgi:hypothetical protein
MTEWKRFDPYAMTFDEVEEQPTTPAKVAKAAKVSLVEAETRPIGRASESQGEASDQRTSSDIWSAEDWRSFYDERAAVAEHEGGLPRATAESRAFACCVVEWLNQNPARSSSVICCWCGGIERAGNELLPFGVGSAGHAWLHSACWNPWREWREREAVAALADLGVNPMASREP